LKSYSLQKTLEDTLTIYKDIQSSLQSSIIKENGLFDLTQLKAERERIDQYLKQRGYYNFNSNFLIFESDTNHYDQRKIRLIFKA